MAIFKRDPKLWVGLSCGVLFVILSTSSLVIASTGERATDFARVGGVTRFGTAMEAATFWRRPTALVIVPMSHGPVELRRATRCAIRLSAPLLFWRSGSESREQMRTFLRQTLAARPHLNVISLYGVPAKSPEFGAAKVLSSCPSVSSAPSEEAAQTRILGRLIVLHQQFSQARQKVGEAPQLLSVARTQPRDELPSSVVFMSPVSLSDAPDVAVGLALATHLARFGEDIGVVVTPRYIEADPVLRERLAEQNTVAQGLVLGSNRRIQDQLQASLRALLPSEQRDVGPLRQVVDDWQALLLAVLAIFFGGVAAERLGRVATNALSERSLSPPDAGLARPNSTQPRNPTGMVRMDHVTAPSTGLVASSPQGLSLEIEGQWFEIFDRPLLQVRISVGAASGDQEVEGIAGWMRVGLFNDDRRGFGAHDWHWLDPEDLFVSGPGRKGDGGLSESEARWRTRVQEYLFEIPGPKVSIVEATMSWSGRGRRQERESVYVRRIFRKQ